jgi:hypothetical protein
MMMTKNTVEIQGGVALSMGNDEVKWRFVKFFTLKQG